MHEIAFLMKLKPGFEEEYKKRHDEIWPELSEALTAAGVSDLQLSIMAQGATPQNKAVAWIRVGRVPDTQRRRRNALVESYVDTAWTTP